MAGDGVDLREIAVAGGTIVARWRGRGPAVLFVHGWALDARIWTPQAVLAERFTLITFDRRGFGRSTAPPEPLREADDMARICDAADVATAHVVAMSQGTRAALALAAGAPDRVGRLVLQGPPCLGPPPANVPDEALPLARAAALARRGDRPGLTALIGEHPLMRTADGASAQLVRGILADYGGRDLIDGGEPVALSEPSVAAITTPTLVLTGRDDLPLRQHAADWLAARLPVARRTTIAGGHLCNVDAAAAFNAEITHFLTN